MYDRNPKIYTVLPLLELLVAFSPFCWVVACVLAYMLHTVAQISLSLSVSLNVHLFQGELAFRFGDLLRKLWAPGAAPVSPRVFKLKLAAFAPQFSGYNQHDSQVGEFPSFQKYTLH